MTTIRDIVPKHTRATIMPCLRYRDAPAAIGPYSQATVSGAKPRGSPKIWVNSARSSSRLAGASGSSSA